MLQDVLTLGDKIDIRRLDRNGKPADNARTYVSQLVDFIDKDVIYIASPIMNSALIILNTGESYNLCFYTGRGLYQCSCVVLSNYKENNTVIAVVRITSNLEKVQRRQYYRLECIIDIEYHVITGEEETLERKIRLNEFESSAKRTEYMNKLSEIKEVWLPASMIDISGGGTRFNSNTILNQDDKILIRLDLTIGAALKRMVLEAEVISSGKIINRVGVYEHRAEFKDINKKDREDLIKYIFEQERRRRKYDPS